MKQLQTLTTNALLGRLSPTPNNFEEHFHSLSIDDIKEILTLKKTKIYENLDMSKESISKKMIKLCINNLKSSAMTSEEEAFGYFTCKKLNNLNNWDKWKAGDKKQIDQFTMQGMFGDPIHPIGLPKNMIILHLH